MKNILIIAFSLISFYGNSQTLQFRWTGGYIIEDVDSIDLITFDGQSNQDGMYDVPLRYRDSLPYVKVWDKTSKSIQNMAWGYGYTRNPSSDDDNLNPIYTTSLYYDSACTPVYMCSYAYPGTQLFYDETILDWNANSVGEYLDSYLNTVDSTIKYLELTGKNIRNIYRIKFQGEQDAIVLEKAQAFYTNETALIEKYNTRFSGYNIHHYLIQVNSNANYIDTVNKAIDSIAVVRSDVDVISKSGFSYLPDNTHIDTTTQVLIGKTVYELTKPSVDTLLLDSATFSGGYSLHNIDFDLSYLSDSNFIPLKTNTSIMLSNSDSLNVLQFSPFHRNYNYDSVIFFQIYAIDTNADGSLNHPMRIGNISEYDSKIDRDGEFNVIPYSNSWRDVPNQSGSLTAAQAAISANDTIIIRTGNYAGYTLNKSHVVAGCGDVVFSETFIGTGAAGIDYKISGIYGYRSSSAANLFGFQSAGGSMLMNNVYADGGFDANNLTGYNVTANNSHFNGDLDLFYNCQINDCYMDSTYRISSRGDTYITFNRSFLPGYRNTNRITAIAANGKLTFNYCELKNGLFTSGAQSYEVGINNCDISVDDITHNFINVNQTGISIANTNIDGGKIDCASSNVSISNSTLNNFTFNQQSVNSNIYLAYILNNTITATDSTLWAFVNSSPNITGNSITTDQKLLFNLSNADNNDSTFYFRNNDVNWSYAGDSREFISLNTDTDKTFNEAIVTGNDFKLERYYGTESGHELYKDINTPSYFAYNKVNGATKPITIQNHSANVVSNEIIYNIFFDCETPITLNSSPNSNIYNNYITNTGLWDLSTVVYLDDNSGLHSNSDSCSFINNLINSNSGVYLNFNSTADTSGFTSSNNINSGELDITVNSVNSTFAEWQALGYDANSLTDITKAAGNGYNLGEPFNIGLVPATTFPNPTTTPQLSSWSIGAYILPISTKVVTKGNFIVVGADKRMIIFNK